MSFLNDGSELVITEIPELRIIEDELWQAVRRRQGALKSRDTGVLVWDRRRPKFLFSGLMVCGCCGGGFSKVSQDSFGCSASRKKGLSICSNRRVGDTLAVIRAHKGEQASRFFRYGLPIILPIIPGHKAA